MSPIATTRIKGRWALQARRKACMGWSWATAYRGGGISWRPPAYSLLEAIATLSEVNNERGSGSLRQTCIRYSVLQ